MGENSRAPLRQLNKNSEDLIERYQMPEQDYGNLVDRYNAILTQINELKLDEAIDSPQELNAEKIEHLLHQLKSIYSTQLLPFFEERISEGENSRSPSLSTLIKIYPVNQNLKKLYKETEELLDDCEYYHSTLKQSFEDMSPIPGFENLVDRYQKIVDQITALNLEKILASPQELTYEKVKDLLDQMLPIYKTQLIPFVEGTSEGEKASLGICALIDNHPTNQSLNKLYDQVEQFMDDCKRNFSILEQHKKEISTQISHCIRMLSVTNLDKMRQQLSQKYFLSSESISSIITKHSNNVKKTLSTYPLSILNWKKLVNDVYATSKLEIISTILNKYEVTYQKLNSYLTDWQSPHAITRSILHTYLNKTCKLISEQLTPLITHLDELLESGPSLALANYRNSANELLKNAKLMVAGYEKLLETKSASLAFLQAELNSSNYKKQLQQQLKIAYPTISPMEIANICNSNIKGQLQNLDRLYTMESVKNSLFTACSDQLQMHLTFSDAPTCRKRLFREIKKKDNTPHPNSLSYYFGHIKNNDSIFNYQLINRGASPKKAPLANDEDTQDQKRHKSSKNDICRPRI